jgi:hypothetical protein
MMTWMMMMMMMMMQVFTLGTRGKILEDLSGPILVPHILEKVCSIVILFQGFC